MPWMWADADEAARGTYREIAEKRLRNFFDNVVELFGSEEAGCPT